MVDLGPNTYPDWRRGSVPSVEEWQRLFSLKLDNSRVVEELASALQKATPDQAAILLSVLVPAVTGKITETGAIVTADGLRQALAEYQPKGDYQPAGNYQAAGSYITGIGHSAGDRTPTNLWGNSHGGVSVNFSDGSAVDLANSTDLTAETNRAKQAEGIIQLPIGTPILWPTNDIPNGFILFDGRQFGKIDNPVLLSLYPSGNVPDMRGLVPRGYDPTGIHDPNGPTRGLLSFQEGTYVKGPETQWSYPITFGENTFPNSDRGLDYVSAGKTGSIHNASPGPGTGGLDPYQPGTSQMSRYGAARMKNLSWNFIGRVG